MRGLRTGKREGAQRTHSALLAPAHRLTTGRWVAQTAKRSRGGEEEKSKWAAGVSSNVCETNLLSESV